ncbi:kinase-regulated stress-responsive transcription factor skn7 [Tulasnella sp. JGI-2019a]|nr:kinase-regulated stress-responsive transcription factor skn7 [Tulasnella sp. JGI-2019a]KAG9024005.1 kinase-regulated stress-responsive transcription factor skn7 [Tulasnella sp. JGI-2019a]
MEGNLFESCSNPRRSQYDAQPLPTAFSLPHAGGFRSGIFAPSEDIDARHNGSVAGPSANGLSPNEAGVLKNTKSVLPFVQELYNRLQDPQIDHLIKWTSSGKYFLVLDREQFMAEFGLQFTSFHRQLNLHDIYTRKSNSGATEELANGAFFHKTFKLRRNRPDLLPEVRKKVPASQDDDAVEWRDQVALLRQELAECRSEHTDQVEAMKQELEECKNEWRNQMEVLRKELVDLKMGVLLGSQPITTSSQQTAGSYFTTDNHSTSDIDIYQFDGPAFDSFPASNQNAFYPPWSDHPGSAVVGNTVAEQGYYNTSSTFNYVAPGNIHTAYSVVDLPPPSPPPNWNAP